MEIHSPLPGDLGRSLCLIQPARRVASITLPFLEAMSPMTKVPFGKTLQELFSGGKPAWIKILGAAFISPVVTLIALIQGGRKTDTSVIWRDPLDLVMILGSMTLLGAVAGACLVLKDIVQKRISDGLPVGFVLRLLFGFGIYSFVFIWIPVLLFAIIFVGYITS